MARQRQAAYGSSGLAWAGVLACAGLFLLFGCGYQAGARGGLTGDLRRVHVGPIRSDAFRAGLQGVVAAAIRRRLVSDGGFHLVDEAAADAVLGGTVVSVQSDAVASDLTDVGRRFRVRIVFRATLRRPAGAAERAREVVGEAFFTAGSGVVGARTAEDEAVQRASQDLAARLVTALVDGW